MTEAKIATECIIFIPFHNNDKSRTPPLSGFLFFFCNSLMTKALHRCKCLIVCLFYPRASTRLHHQVAHVANPWPAGDFPWCSAVAQCVTDLRVGGRFRVWLADTMCPGMLLKVWSSAADLAHKTWANINLIFYSFASFQVESFWPWFHVSLAY